MISFFVLQTLRLFNEDDPFFSVRRLASDWQRISLSEFPFMFAVEKVDPRAATLVANAVFWDKSEGKKRTPLSLVQCSELLPGGQYEDQSREEYTYLDLLVGRKGEDFLCPNDLDQHGLQGNYGMPVFEYIEIMLLGCALEPATECMGDVELAKKSFNFAFLSPQPVIDNDDREQLVQYRADISHFFYYDPTIIQTKNIFFMQSKIIQKDNIKAMVGYSKKEVDIAEYAWTQSVPILENPTLAVKDRAYIKVFLRQADSIQMYKRVEYDLLQWSSSIGGAQTAIFLIGVLVSQSVATRTFFAAIIQEVYRVQ